MAALRVRNLDLLRRRDARTHKSATMTLDLSGQLFADQLDEVADAMSAARPRSRSCGLFADEQRRCLPIQRREQEQGPMILGPA